MELWTREDGRFMAMDLYRDLWGPAVVVWYGGRNVSRVATYPVASTVEGEKKLDELAARRRQHGYRCMECCD